MGNPVTYVDISGFSRMQGGFSVSAPGPSDPRNGDLVSPWNTIPGRIIKAVGTQARNGLATNLVRDGLLRWLPYTNASVDIALRAQASLGAALSVWGAISAADHEMDRFGGSWAGALSGLMDLSGITNFAVDNPDALADAVNSADAVLINKLTFGVFDLSGKDVANGVNANANVANAIQQGSYNTGVAIGQKVNDARDYVESKGAQLHGWISSHWPF